jgi:choice-of-anchor C domain-containing protein
MKMRLLAAAAALSLSGTAQAAILVNGSFEDGVGQPLPGEFVNLPSGSTNIAGWTVGNGGIDWIDNGYWEASDGQRSLDLSGTAAGSISQTFATIAGVLYTVTFDLAGNPDGPDETKVEITSVNGQPFQEFFFFDVGPGNTRQNMGWETKSFSFTANSNLTTLSFGSATQSAFGPALDNVSIAAVPEPGTWLMMIVGFGLLGGMLRGRRRAALPPGRVNFAF